MTLHCKPGDLAYLTYGPQKGRVFEVLSTSGFDPELGHMWNVKASAPVEVWQCWTATSLGKREHFDCPDAWLRRIGGVPVEDEVTREIKEPA